MSRQPDWDDAAKAEADGLPSLLPDRNIYKRTVENHRWGKHGAHAGGPFPDTCPACARKQEVTR